VISIYFVEAELKRLSERIDEIQEKLDEYNYSTLLYPYLVDLKENPKE
jgi:tetrahydromethanopterin S-methyltransferase subunit G